MFYKLTSSFSPLTSNETEQAELAKVELYIILFFQSAKVLQNAGIAKEKA